MTTSEWNHKPQNFCEALQRAVLTVLNDISTVLWNSKWCHSKSWSPNESGIVVIIKNPGKSIFAHILNAEQTKADGHHAPGTCPTSVDFPVGMLSV